MLHLYTSMPMCCPNVRLSAGVTYNNMIKEIKSHRENSAAQCAAAGKDDAVSINFGRHDCVLVTFEGEDAPRAGKVSKVHRAKSGKHTYTVKFVDGETNKQVSPELMQWDEDAMSGFYVSKRKMFGHFRYLAALRKEKDQLATQTSFDIYW